jgi:L-ascorbate metabolism protein UlaG (beta-lactamase superfamily)
MHLPKRRRAVFDIEYKGGNCVIISTKKSKLIADPKLSVVGLKDLPAKNAIEVTTEQRFLVNDPEARLVVEGPGEYEVEDFSIRGIPATRHIDTDATEPVSTIYRIEVGDVGIALIGNVASRLSEDQLEAIGVVDMAILPIGGGGYTLDHISAATLVRQIDPKVVIPIHYADPGLAYEVPQDSLEAFTKEIGAPVESTLKYRVKSATALPAVMSVVEIKRS